MSTEELKRELTRIGDTAPVADVRADTWSKAQRARHRDWALALAAGVTAVALAAGLAAWLPTHDDLPVADAAAPGLPDRLYSVPDRMSARDNDDGWVRDEVTSDVAIGAAAAAWLTPAGGLPVVVDADAGGYHLLDLPDFAGNNRLVSRGLYEPTLALSPNGRRLAYSWATFGPDAAMKPIPSGVRVVDLMTGQVLEFALPGAEGTAVTALAWSPNGSWLAWAGDRLASWTTGSVGGGQPKAGRISLADETKQDLDPGRVDTTDASVAVDNQGRVTLVADSSMLRWDGHRRVVTHDVPLGLGASIMAPASPNGYVALASYGSGSVTVTNGSDRRVVDVGITRDDARVQPLGWVGDDLLVVSDHNDGSDGEMRLVSVDGGTPRVVGTVEGGLKPTLTVAIDLVSSERPTVPRPEPDWPWSEERWAFTIAAVLLGLGFALWAGFAVRRRYRPAR